MTGVILLFLLGLVLMVKGGDSFVEGAEWMARVTGFSSSGSPISSAASAI